MKLSFVFFSFLFSLQTWAQKTDSKGQVLDFEGEVIEGERKRPDLFLQISTKDLSFDSLLYLRKNFNDYHEVDKKSRNNYFKVKGK